MLMSRRCNSLIFLNKTMVSFLLCVCLSFMILYILNREVSTFPYERQIVRHWNASYTRHLNTIDARQPVHHLVNATLPFKATVTKRVNEAFHSIKHNSTETRTDGEDTKITVKDKLKIFVYFPLQVKLIHHIRLLKMKSCKIKTCIVKLRLVEKRDTIEGADAIVFQGNQIPDLRPARRDAEQVFVFLNNEPPLYVHSMNLKQKAFSNYFNWTMTFREDSDIPFLYGSIIPNTNNWDKNIDIKRTERYNHTLQTVLERNYTSIFRKKKKNAIWLVSHCYTQSQREIYVDQMRDYTSIDQFGLCNQKPLLHDTFTEVLLSKRYKFFLAFENTLCSDYVTEKVFKWFARDLVLVVRGGCDYSKFIPTGTYVDASKFATPVELAKYLTELGRNENEYIKILKTKDKYRVMEEMEMIQLAFCNLCNRLNNVSEYRQSIANISSWWKVNSCWEPNDILK